MTLETRPIDPTCRDTGVALRFEETVRRYGRTVALDHLNLSVGRGETVALLGANGAGKSTAFALLLGLLRPHGGAVEVLGMSPHQAMAAGRVGAMLQQATGHGLPPGARVKEALRLVRGLYRHPAPLEEVVEHSGIAELLARQTNRLSGGETQLVRFAIAIAGDPELVFLDEPTAALDVVARRRFWERVRQLREEGRTIVFATHHLEETDNAERVVVINHGRVVADGPGATLKAAVATRQVRFVVAQPSRPDQALLDRLEGVTDVDVRGTSVVLSSLDADATVRDLVRRGVAFQDLEVVGAHLEEAFVALTRGASGPEAPNPAEPPAAGGR